MGPTAAGKTKMAIDLAGRVDCELISVDSAQVYRGLDIGTAKPIFPHHLISIRDPVETYSAVEFAEDANNICFEICNRGKIPVLVGGSMLYFRILLEGFSNIPPVDPIIRRELEVEGSKKGWSRLHARLSTLDPILASKIHPNHSRRISRALEVYYSTGKPLSEWHRDGKATTHFAKKFEIYKFAIKNPGETLSLKIKQTGSGINTLIATHNAKRITLSNKNLLKSLLTHPLMGIKILLGIHWEALKLFIKGVKLVPYQN